MARTSRIAFLAAALATLGAPGAAEAGKPLPPQFYIASYGSELENFGPARVVVGRTGNIKKAGSVTLTPTQISLSDAMAGVDFDPTPFVISFARNVSQREVFIPFIDDTTAEGQEIYRLVLSSPSVGTVGPDATPAIIDDDESGLFTVPEGSTLSVGGRLGACHQTSAAAITLSGDMLASLATGGGCVDTTISAEWLNDTGSTVVAKIALTDQHCDDGYVYYSDHTGTGVGGSSSSGVFDHAAAWGNQVRILDAGGSCSHATANRQPSAAEEGNLVLTVLVLAPV